MKISTPISIWMLSSCPSVFGAGRGRGGRPSNVYEEASTVTGWLAGGGAGRGAGAVRQPLPEARSSSESSSEDEGDKYDKDAVEALKKYGLEKYGSKYTGAEEVAPVVPERPKGNWRAMSPPPMAAGQRQPVAIPRGAGPTPPAKP